MNSKFKFCSVWLLRWSKPEFSHEVRFFYNLLTIFCHAPAPWNPMLFRPCSMHSCSQDTDMSLWRARDCCGQMCRTQGITAVCQPVPVKPLEAVWVYHWHAAKRSLIIKIICSQAVKHLRTPEFKPYVIFVKPLISEKKKHVLKSHMTEEISTPLVSIPTSNLFFLDKNEVFGLALVLHERAPLPQQELKWGMLNSDKPTVILHFWWFIFYISSNANGYFLYPQNDTTAVSASVSVVYTQSTLCIS